MIGRTDHHHVEDWLADRCGSLLKKLSHVAPILDCPDWPTLRLADEHRAAPSGPSI